MTVRLAAIEASFFRALNRIAEPLVRAGWGSPLLTPSGLIVLETTGWRTGIARRLPVLATMIEGHALVGSIRADRSHWVKNLRVTPDVRYWLGGRAREATAIVLDSDGEPPEIEMLPPRVRWVAAGLRTVLVAPNVAVAVLAPNGD
ncbi:MAG: nitroreductase family deazaflavin-dependent oxidoreductase [Chloroflexi bacterium]|nr:nitroreductase family deazaflavin-dependent oxidoreductase [Chloroflexota bacterium]